MRKEREEDSQTQYEEQVDIRRNWLKKASKVPGWKRGDPETKKYLKEQELMCVQCGHIWIKVSEEQVRCVNCYPRPKTRY